MDKVAFKFLDTPQGRVLQSSLPAMGGNFFLDYAHGPLGYRLQAKRVMHEPLAKVISRGAFVFDATGGIAKDAIMMALLGCKVWTCEAHPLIASLVQDGLERVRHLTAYSLLFEQESFNFFAVDALTKLSEFYAKPLEQRPDIIYLDPMFPAKVKSSSAKKTMQWLQHIHAHTSHMYPDYSVAEPHELLSMGLKLAQKRVVVKRPLHAGPLTLAPEVSFSRRFQSARFDVYVPKFNLSGTK